MAGYFPYRTLNGETGGAVQDFIVKNSETLTLGDHVQITAGYASLTGNAARGMGVVIGFGKDLGNGQNVPLDMNAAGTVTGTRSGNAGSIGSDTYVAASNNVTVDKVTCRVIIDHNMLYYNDADGDLTQAMVGNYFLNTSSSDQISQSSNTAAFDEANATEQWILMNRDPHSDADLSKGIFKCVKHQLQG